jgi:hypothetical protein
MRALLDTVKNDEYAVFLVTHQQSILVSIDIYNGIRLLFADLNRLRSFMDGYENTEFPPEALTVGDQFMDFRDYTITGNSESFRRLMGPCIH